MNWTFSASRLKYHELGSYITNHNSRRLTPLPLLCPASIPTAFPHANLATSSITLSTPSPINAEHSAYLAAPIRLACQLAYANVERNIQSLDGPREKKGGRGNLHLGD